MPKIKDWLKQSAFYDYFIEPASSDASFRSYYRLRKNKQTFILMDSSLLLESLEPFVQINKRLSSVGVAVPQILAKNMQEGYLILEDFGREHYQDILTKKNYHSLYKKAIDEIIKMQKAPIENMPSYDKDFLLFEMDLMQEWYLEAYLQKSLSSKEKEDLKNILATISLEVLAQPQGVFVHRDFHSRNIMLTAKGEIGIIDFQDARVGAITYDLVSLLKDVYIEWNADEVEKLALYYRDKRGLKISDKRFIRYFDFMGLQRHIKILGIFARLSLRDGKDNYLQYIPLTLKYILQTAKKYEEMNGLVEILKIKERNI